MDENTYKKLKKIRLVAISGWIVAVLMAVLLVFNLGDSTHTPSGDFSAMSGQGGGRGLMNVSNFLDDNGQVDYEAIEQMKVDVPSERLEMVLSRMTSQLDQAVSDGEITSAQATAIYNAFK